MKSMVGEHKNVCKFNSFDQSYEHYTTELKDGHLGWWRQYWWQWPTMRTMSCHGGSPSTISTGIIYKSQNFYTI